MTPYQYALTTGTIGILKVACGFVLADANRQPLNGKTYETRLAAAKAASTVLNRALKANFNRS